MNSASMFRHRRCSDAAASCMHHVGPTGESIPERKDWCGTYAGKSRASGDGQDGAVGHNDYGLIAGSARFASRIACRWDCEAGPGINHRDWPRVPSRLGIWSAIGRWREGCRPQCGAQTWLSVRQRCGVQSLIVWAGSMVCLFTGAGLAKVYLMFLCLAQTLYAPLARGHLWACCPDLAVAGERR